MSIGGYPRWIGDDAAERSSVHTHVQCGHADANHSWIAHEKGWWGVPPPASQRIEPYPPWSLATPKRSLPLDGLSVGAGASDQLPSLRSSILSNTAKRCGVPFGAPPVWAASRVPARSLTSPGAPGIPPFLARRDQSAPCAFPDQRRDYRVQYRRSRCSNSTRSLCCVKRVPCVRELV